MQEPVTFLQKTLDTVVELLVNYSFQVLGAIIILIVGIAAGRWAARLMVSLGRSRHADPNLTKFAAGFAKGLVIGFAVLVALGKFGITIAPIVAGLSALAFGGSFAIQGPLSNYGAGLSILLTRPFRVGDTITVVEVSGVVEEIKLACTILSTEDGEKITIPNKHIVGEVLRNSAAYRVVEAQVGISYGDDPQRAAETIRGALRRFPEVAATPAPLVGIHAFGDSAITLGLRYWVPTRQHFQLAYAVNLAVFQALKDAGITIPFPQRDVRLLEGASARR